MMNDLQSTLNARLSGMRWGEREKADVLRIIRMEAAMPARTERRGIAMIACAVATVMLFVGSAVTLWQRNSLFGGDPDVAGQGGIATVTDLTGADAQITAEPTDEAGFLPVVTPMPATPVPSPAPTAVLDQISREMSMDGSVPSLMSMIQELAGTIAASANVTDEPTVRPTETPGPTPTASPTATPSPTPTARPTPSPAPEMATETDLQPELSTATPAPTSAPVPDPSASPALTRAPYVEEGDPPDELRVNRIWRN